ncbi:MAG: hypothetical protein IKR22_06765, partial [Clostridiales bacterium]|nr:hypothetical protein [Clostridiales bacterium]
KLERFMAKVSSELEARKILVSHGFIITDPKSDKSLEDYLVMADQHMYEVKRERKGGAVSRLFGSQLSKPEPYPRKKKP